MKHWDLCAVRVSRGVLALVRWKVDMGGRLLPASDIATERGHKL